MKAAILIPLSLILLQQTNGCEESKKVPPSPKETPIRRFEPVTSHGTSDVALDTKTGRLCRTWDWEYKNNPTANDINNLPTCYSLFNADQNEVVITPADMKKP